MRIFNVGIREVILLLVIMLILFGIAFIIIETRNRNKEAKVTAIADITYTTALLIGIFQLIAAIFPASSQESRPRHQGLQFRTTST